MESNLLVDLNFDKPRNLAMHQIFGDFTKGQVCLATFSCAFKKKILPTHGRLFVTAKSICFHASYPHTIIAFRFIDVASIEKSNDLGFPTAITICTKYDRYFFCSLILNRDAAFTSLTKIHHRNREALPKQSIAPEYCEPKVSPAKFTIQCAILVGIVCALLLCISSYHVYMQAMSLMQLVDSAALK